MLEPGHWQVGTGRTDLLVRRLGRKIFMVIENDQRTKVGVSYRAPKAGSWESLEGVDNTCSVPASKGALKMNSVLETELSLQCSKH